MSHPDAFALKNSGLNEFLFAEIGTELNGSPLTILSILARLGQDPWAEAARLTKLPKAAMIDCLAQSIAKMPLGQRALRDARVTAARLVLLLPGQTSTTQQSESVTTTAPTMPRWQLLAILWCALAFGMAVNAILVPHPTAAVTTPIGQTVEHTP